MGHTLGLIHPEDDPVTAPHANNSVMQTHWNYPNYAPNSERPWGFLTAERNIILSNPFMHLNVDLEQIYPNAEVVNLPVTGTAPQTGFDIQISGKTIIFDNESVDASLSYWTFGDGFASNNASPTHTYSADGTYTVKLRASNSVSMMGIDSMAIEIKPDTARHPCDWGDEVDNSTIPLHLPFETGTTWQVGGPGYYYGDSTHNDSINDYYATDWNRVAGNSFGQPVYPVALGIVDKVVSNCGSCTVGYGNHVDVVHSLNKELSYGVLKTRYAHLSKVSVAEGDIVYIDTKLGEVGSTGGVTGPHLHLSFQVYNGSQFVSKRDIDPSRRPGPMVAGSGTSLELWGLCDGQSRTVADKHFFTDVPRGSWSKKWIDAVYAWGVMEECVPNKFCPDVPVTRADIAVFALRSFGNYPPATGGAGGGGIEIPSTWQVDLTVKDAGSGTATLNFGQAPSATDGLDAAFGEAELPPIPPAGSFDARFELPVSPPAASAKDYRADSTETTTWKIRFQPGQGGYPVTLSWNRAALPAGELTLKDAITGTLINVNMHDQDSLSVSNNAISTLLIEKPNVILREANVAAGWNIISVPVRAGDMRVGSLFPGAASSAYRFENGYVVTDTLSNSAGYWLKFNNASTYQISGAKITDRQIPVNAGWNIIGPFESDVPTSLVGSTPAGIIQSGFFGFDNGYITASTLQVGKGYWVKVGQTGSLQLSGTTVLCKSIEIARFDNTETVSWPAIHFEDDDGRSGTLYLSPLDELGGAKVRSLRPEYN